MSQLYLEVGGQWKMNFCWSRSLIARSIYNRVQKVGTRAPAAASVTLPREHQLLLGSRGEPCTPRQQSAERDLCQAKRVSGSSCEALSCQPLLPLTQLLTGLPPQSLHTKNGTGWGKQTSLFFCKKTSPFLSLQAFLLLNQLSYRKKIIFVSPWKYKERLHS